MRVTYWSHSRLAAKIRSMFGLVQLPPYETFEGWEDYRKNNHKISKFGVKLVDSLDTIQDAWLFIPDKLKSIAYYFSNIKNQSHVLRTSAERGQWQDLCTRIPDALLLSVVDFVEKECFWMNIMGMNDNSPVGRYGNQSYIMRKLFPIEISQHARFLNGFEFMDFQINATCTTTRQKERHPYQKIKAAYLFAVGDYKTFDAYKEVGYDLDVENMFVYTQEKKEQYAKIAVLEAAHEREITKHCYNIVKYREFLWT